MIKSKQAGISLVGALGIVAVAATALTLGIKTAPHYIVYRAIVAVVEVLDEDRVHDMSKVQIRRSLERNFQINNISELKVSDIFVIVRNRARTRLELNYEKRQHLLGNIDIVLVFKKSFEFR
ncbi:MAG: DUF4845 domain-containing protein [Arenicellales bacterium]|nr:DUF4845 domain-containing protein [Arenicellales bacterium]